MLQRIHGSHVSRHIDDVFNAILFFQQLLWKFPVSGIFWQFHSCFHAVGLWHGLVNLSRPMSSPFWAHQNGIVVSISMRFSSFHCFSFFFHFCFLFLLSYLLFPTVVCFPIFRHCDSAFHVVVDHCIRAVISVFYALRLSEIVHAVSNYWIFRRGTSWPFPELYFDKLDNPSVILHMPRNTPGGHKEETLCWFRNPCKLCKSLLPSVCDSPPAVQMLRLLSFPCLVFH